MSVVAYHNPLAVKPIPTMRQFIPLLLIAFLCGFSAPNAAAQDSASYDDLVQLFTDWRSFENPPLLNGAPNYTKARFDEAQPEFSRLQDRLQGFDISEWPVEQQVDWHVIRAEMNGYDFNYRILKPWERDPAYYQTIWDHRSDVPAHEGPTHHAILELWTYDFPLSTDETDRLHRELKVIAPLMRQAQQNLTGNARDLWTAGIRNIETQYRQLEKIETLLGDDASDSMTETIADAKSATQSLVEWLKEQAPSKMGPSGMGRDAYTWYLQQVHYVPLDWDDEVRLLKRELDRSWSSLKLEEQRNRDLPQLDDASSPEEYNEMAEGAVRRIMDFVRDKDIFTIRPYDEPALRAHMGSYVPAEERNFFRIASHLDPAPLFTHFYHWWDLAQMDNEPHASPIRRGPVLYNIYDSRNEGTATGVEEMFMHAGLYDDSPRSREIVWIMLAQRAARGLGSLYAHANDMTMAEAGTVHVAWTPRGWMTNEPELLRFEQHLYLRQPGYGTSYVTGKYLLERLLAVYTKKMEEAGEAFSISKFFDALNGAGNIPIALVHWQLTGDDTDIQKIMSAATE